MDPLAAIREFGGMGIAASREDLAWLAGFFEGEGTIATAGKVGDRQHIQLSIPQTQMEPLERAQRILGYGRIYERTNPGRLGTKRIWVLRFTRFEFVQASIAAMWHWLSPAKRAKAAMVLGLVAESYTPRRKATHCRRGHPYDDPYVWGTNRYCRPCRALSEARRAAKRREEGT